MPEEAHTDPALEPDTPHTEVDEPAPTGDTPEPQIDWEKRYNDLRSFSDRRFQEAQETLETYEERLARLEAPVSPDVDVDDDDDWYDNPLEDPRIRAQVERLDRLEAQLTQKAEQETLARKQEAQETYIDTQLERIESEFNDKLNDDEASWIGNFALAHPDEQGNPDVELAYVAFNKLLEGRKSQWVETKRSPAAPATGPAAVEAVDFASMTRQQRLDHINQRIAELEAGEDS